MQLASDVTALSNLRMSLRNLMSKSPVCDGPNFILGLESTYRKMWQRYCKGDVPSLRRMELLQQQEATEGTITTMESNIPALKESPASIQSNGHCPVSSEVINHSPCGENGDPLPPTKKPGRLNWKMNLIGNCGVLFKTLQEAGEAVFE